jgi:hypothetical protein
MPFTPGDEADAEAEEARVHAAGGDHGAGDSTRAAADAASAGNASKEALELAIQQIKDRVIDMAAEAMRTQIQRNGIQRRP